ncbi:MAG: phosphoenolpyruvate--protein phosphotransferase [Fibrobacteria bacterium]|nr:phosphoenolpyruvate--protein phosphotransferase [Fibrobacteria bacterium]
MSNEKEIRGTPVINGKGLGKAYYTQKVGTDYQRRNITSDGVGKEILQFNEIRKKAKVFYMQMQISSQLQIDASILKIYSGILDDPSFVGAIVDAISKNLVCLETAIRDVSAEIVTKFDSIQADFFKERSADITEVCEKLISYITTNTPKIKFSEPKILIVPGTFTPSDIFNFDESMIKGIVAFNAGPTSHAVIIARAHGIPLVSRVKYLNRNVQEGTSLLLDGYTGTIYINPNDKKIKEIEVELAYKSKIKRLGEAHSHLAVSKDGIPISVSANVAFLKDIHQAMEYGADSIGLVRSEYIFFKWNRAPSFNEQKEYYESLFDVAKGKHLIIRLLDIGGDKTPSYLKLPKEFNPFMGWRGIRILLQKPDFFMEHLTAIMSAAAGRSYGLLAPMVSTLKEWKHTKQFIIKTAISQNVPVPECGILFEVPLALLEMEQFLYEIDFASIGTNDLIQYLLAADRNNPNVNYLHNPIAPAFLNILRNACETARKGGKSLSICGEFASYPMYTLLLLGIGLRSFSVTPDHIPIIKEIISKVAISDIANYMEHLFSKASAEEMLDNVKSVNKKLIPKICEVYAPYFKV